MSLNRYSLAGWLAISNAILFFPRLGLVFFIKWVSLSQPEAGMLLVPFYLVSLAISVYVLWMFRILLHELDSFHGTDLLITILIWISVGSAGAGILGSFPQSLLGAGVVSLSGASALASFVLVVALLVCSWVVSIVFGVRLLSMRDDLFGLLKPFAYTTMASGICGLTVLAAPIGLLLTLVSSVIQGMIFLRAREEVQYV